MKSRKIVYTIFKTCIAFVIFIIIAGLAYKLCEKSYKFGYRIFAEEPLSPAPGITVSVAIVEGKSAMEIGKILEEKGLIRSAYLFYLQEAVSSYHGKLKPGVYELSTAMTAEQMMAVMAAEPQEEEDVDSVSSNEADIYGDPAMEADYDEGLSDGDSGINTGADDSQVSGNEVTDQ